MKKQRDIYKTYFSTMIIWTMFLSCIIPLQAKPIRDNSVLNQTETTKADTPLLNKSVFFEQNEGQFDKQVKFFARGTKGYSLFLTSTEAVYLLKSPTSNTQNADVNETQKGQNSEQMAQHSTDAVYMSLVGANQDSVFSGAQKREHITNYFKGKESNWRTNIPNFTKVKVENIYDGIDMIWNGKENGKVQYDFVVEPGITADQIEWNIKGAESIKIDKKGSLIIETKQGVIEQAKPFTYQLDDNAKIEAESSFKLIGETRVGFNIDNYDTNKTLIIDPTVTGPSPLNFSTVIGGSGEDRINAIDIGSDGKIYAVGTTGSTDFPITGGLNRGSSDAFVAVFSSDGSNLISSTVIGSDGPDSANDMKFDDTNGWVYFTGATANTANGATFPTTGTGYDQTENGGQDAYVYIYQPSNNMIIYSSFLGSDFTDEGNAIELDSSGNFYITGSTSTGQITVNPFPITTGAFDETHNGGADVFVTKMSFNGQPHTHLLYSTFIGGGNTERAYDMKLDSNNNVVITGETNYNGLFGNYPTTPGAFDTSHNLANDTFVTKLNSDGSALMFSTYLGGDDRDKGNALTLDQSDNIYVTGVTRSSNTPFPTTSGAFDETHNGGDDDIFVSKLNPNGTQLLYSTFLGGNRQDIGYAIEVDGLGSVLIGGFVESTNFPITLDAYDSAVTGNSDAALTRLNSDGSEVTYSTFIGGISEDQINDIIVASPTSIFFAGETFLSGFPTTTGAYDTSANGNYDGFLTKFTLPSANANKAPYDFDGDSKTDVSIFRPGPGEWWFLRSSDGGNGAFQFGSSTDVIVPGDYTGDGKTDVAFYRPSSSEWFVIRSEDSTFYSFPFGSPGDIPAPGDFDGDGTTDTAVYHPPNSTWYILNSTGGTTITPFGTIGDKPVVADYDGDGKDDIGIYRPSNSQWWLNRSNDGVIVYQFGQAGDKTVQGDYTGDGKADVAFWRPSNGFWFVIRSEDQSFFSFPYGANGDVPVAGDYDGDGIYDAAVFRDSQLTWFINGSTSGTQILGFGISGDTPIASAYVYD